MAVGNRPERTFADLPKMHARPGPRPDGRRAKHMPGCAMVKTGAVEPPENDRCGGLPTVTKFWVGGSTKSANLISRPIRALTGVSLRSTASSATWDPQSAFSRRRNLSHSVPCGDPERATNRMEALQWLAGSLGNSLRLQDK